MKSFVGKICSADSSARVFEVYCEDGIKGVTMGQRVLIIPIGNKIQSEWGHIQDRMAQFDQKKLEFPE